MTEPLLEDKDWDSAFKSFEYATKQSLFLRFKVPEYYGEQIHSSPLIVNEPMQSVAVSANWIYGRMVLHLMRNGKEIAYQYLFAPFDASMNQTDRMLTKYDCLLVREAQPGDQLLIKGYKNPYILKLQLELLPED